MWLMIYDSLNLYKNSPLLTNIKNRFVEKIRFFCQKIVATLGVGSDPALFVTCSVVQPLFRHKERNSHLTPRTRIYHHVNVKLWAAASNNGTTNALHAPPSHKSHNQCSLQKCAARLRDYWHDGDSFQLINFRDEHTVRSMGFSR